MTTQKRRPMRDNYQGDGRERDEIYPDSQHRTPLNLLFFTFYIFIYFQSLSWCTLCVCVYLSLSLGFALSISLNLSFFQFFEQKVLAALSLCQASMDGTTLLWQGRTNPHPPRSERRAEPEWSSNFQFQCLRVPHTPAERREKVQKCKKKVKKFVLILQ